MTSQTKRSIDTLVSARHLLETDPASAVNRAYYAAFYAARGAVRLQGSNPKTHSGPADEVGRLLVLRGIISSKLGAFYSRFQTKREVLDYGEDDEISNEEAGLLVDEAEEFIQALLPLVTSDKDDA